MNKTKRGIVAFLLAATILISVVGMASADSLRWDFDDDNTMYRGVHTETGTVTIAGTDDYRWDAENPATVSLTFSADIWTFNLECQSASADKKFTVDIGKWDGIAFTSYGTSSEYSFSTSTLVTGSIIANKIPISTGEYLAAKVTNTGSVAFTLQTIGQQHCDITYPPDTPDYPYPELSTLVLLSFGLLALFGYVGYRRRNNKQ